MTSTEISKCVASQSRTTLLSVAKHTKVGPAMGHQFKSSEATEQTFSEMSSQVG